MQKEQKAIRNFTYMNCKKNELKCPSSASYQETYPTYSFPFFSMEKGEEKYVYAVDGSSGRAYLERNMVIVGYLLVP